MQWSQALRPCALAALIAAVGMVLKLVAPLIGVVGAGFLAVAFYRREHPGAIVRAGSGARIGALCGLLCSAMTAVLGTVRVVVLHEGNLIRQTLLENVKQTASRYSDPQFQPGLDFMRSSTGLVLMMAFLLFIAFLSFLVMGTLGGALGGAMFGRHERN